MKQTGSVATSGYIFGAIAGAIAGAIVCFALSWHWLYLFLAVPLGLVFGSFYPGVGFAMLFAGSSGDKSPQDRQVRIVHSLAFLAGPPVGLFLGSEWGIVGMLIGAVGGGMLFLLGAMLLSNALNLPSPTMSRSQPDNSRKPRAPRQEKPGKRRARSQHKKGS